MDTDDLIPELNRVLKYSHETVQNLLTQLSGPEHTQTRQGGPNADHTFRGVLADAIDETDRPFAQKESARLRDPKQHVFVPVTEDHHQFAGSVMPATYTADHIHDMTHLIRHHLIHAYSGDGLFDSVGFSMPTLRYLEKDGTATLSENGHLFSTTHVANAAPLLADRIQHRLDAIDGGRHNRSDGHLQDLLNRLRQAPFERVNWSHPSIDPT
jgi:hypothetical protein